VSLCLLSCFTSTLCLLDVAASKADRAKVGHADAPKKKVPHKALAAPWLAAGAHQAPNKQASTGNRVRHRRAAHRQPFRRGLMVQKLCSERVWASAGDPAAALSTNRPRADQSSHHHPGPPPPASPVCVTVFPAGFALDGATSRRGKGREKRVRDRVCPAPTVEAQSGTVKSSRKGVLGEQRLLAP